MRERERESMEKEREILERESLRREGWDWVEV
jgi:hypothetical protein